MDRAHPAYRMLVARLYNAGVKVAVLEEVFNLDHKTIRAWGLVLYSGDLDGLQRMHFGTPGKINADIKAFIAQRWPELRTQRCRNHRDVLEKEIKAYFRVSLSGESLRVMMDRITSEKAGAGALTSAAPEAVPQAAPPPAASLDLMDATLVFDFSAAAGVPHEPPDEAAISHAPFPAGEKSEPSHRMPPRPVPPSRRFGPRSSRPAVLKPARSSRSSPPRFEGMDLRFGCRFRGGRTSA